MDMDLEESPGPHEASEALNSGLSTSCDLQILHSGGDPSQDYNEIKKVIYHYSLRFYGSCTIE